MSEFKMGHDFIKNQENRKQFKEADTSYDDAENFETDVEIKYDDPVKKDDFIKFKSQINNLISQKAAEMGVSEEAIIKLARLNMESLETPIETDEELINKKAEELGISKEEAAKKIGDADLESLKTPYYTKLNQGNLELLKETMSEAIEDVHKNRRGKIRTERFSIVKKAMEFVGSHKKVLNLGALALYLSTFGSGALKSLAGDHAKIVMDNDGAKGNDKSIGHNDNLDKHTDSTMASAKGLSQNSENGNAEQEYKNKLKVVNSWEGIASKMDIDNKSNEESIGSITTEQLAKDPNLIALIDSQRSMNSPIDVLDHLNDAGDFAYKDGKFSLSVDDGRVYMKGLPDDTLNKLDAGLNNTKFSFNQMKDEGVTVEVFSKNENVITGSLAKDLNVSQKDFENYCEKVLLPDASKVSVVKFNDFHVPVDKEGPEVTKMKNAKEEIYKKNGLNAFGQVMIDEPLQKQVDNIFTNEDKLIDSTTQEQRDIFLKNIEKERLAKADKELGEWTEKEYGHKDFNSEMNHWVSEESGNSHLKMKLAELHLKEIDSDSYENNEEFKDMLLKDLAKAGYTPQILAEKNPKQIVEIVSQVVCDNLKYDYVEKKYSSDHPSYNLPKEAKYRQKHESLPAATLGTHTGICHDYAITVGAAIDVLKKMGVSDDLDNEIVLATTFLGHESLVLVAAEGDKIKGDTIKISFVDPTFHDFGYALDGVDKNHSYGGVTKEFYNKHEGKLLEGLEDDNQADSINIYDNTIKRIEEHNLAVFKEEIYDYITRYYPDFAKGRKIELDKDSYKAILQNEQKRMAKEEEQLNATRENIKRIADQDQADKYNLF